MENEQCSLRRMAFGKPHMISCVSDMSPTYFPSLPPPYHLPLLITSVSVKGTIVFFTFKLQISIIFTSLSLPVFSCIALLFSSALCISHLFSAFLPHSFILGEALTTLTKIIIAASSHWSLPPPNRNAAPDACFHTNSLSHGSPIK